MSKVRTMTEDSPTNGVDEEAWPPLVLVATPIGNLEDISLRALRILKSVDIIASEDTRKTGLLLKRYAIEKRQISLHEHNEERAIQQILAFIRQGKHVAVVTDAGTPGIADPGYLLVRKALEENIPLTMVPGPAAFVMALVLSGLPSHSFTFRGFPPRKAGPRRRFFEMDRDSPHTLIYYESPYRLIESLEMALEVFGDRPAALANDLTKRFERVDRGLLSEILAVVRGLTLRGEFVLLIAGCERSDRSEGKK
ncbi:probable S-adenosylmethionine-dependent methyltransferase, YraL family [Chthonomonas calidirosea]|uniref:16S rRNA (cytidine(1402)-2'-O)-methyltransferase n=1 Tax=Chthonomonas calidirosea TaxID=454171 RepID=UPI0006DD479A|nr:16S rRNA (cytidine(1402)-2'-O)-methyltransferase [Chthonomonas calidirosea]CEK14222.1 probable S-adenosylmethionine-dependent methyltransferase, YraL family [Chthonomonas calidirosea]